MGHERRQACYERREPVNIQQAKFVHNAPFLIDRAELLCVLTLPDFERADRIGEFWGYPERHAFAELLIDR